MNTKVLHFKIIYGRSYGLEKKALETVYETVSAHVRYTVTTATADSVSQQTLSENNLIIIGTPESNCILKQLADNGTFKPATEKEGFFVKVMPSIYNDDAQMIIISGFDDAGTLYGAVDFEAYYIPFAENNHNKDCYFSPLFSGEKMKEYEKTSSPSVKRRGLWTWGHVIYDYEGYIKNMMKLKMNTLIIWNDCVPININDVIDFAHQHGISIYLGFSWGWNEARPCNGEGLDISDEKIISHLKDVIVDKYKANYQNLNIDGIYFQSFTETTSDSVNGTVIAQCVVNLVNSTAGELFNIKPDLQLMFGLHASSVSEKLEYIKNTDNRIMIVWEDCGAFPFDYIPKNTDGFDKTCDLVKKVSVLRGEDDNFGVVTKGFVCLDWLSFEHQKGEFIMGRHSKKFIEERTRQKEKLWNYVNSYWLQNADFAYDMIKLMFSSNKNSMITALVEDGMFENKIPVSTALYSEMLWNCESSVKELVSAVSMRRDI